MTVAIISTKGATATATSTANVLDAPLTATWSDLSGRVAGASASGVVVAFLDVNPSCNAADYTASIDWGDGVTSAGTVGTAQSGGSSVTATHAYAAGGSYPALATIADIGGGSTTASGTVVVAGAALSGSGVNLSTTEWSSYTGAVATLAVPNTLATADQFRAVIAWGDGGQSDARITAVAGSPGHFTIAGDHTYLNPGMFAVSASIRDFTGVSGSSSSTATVSDAPLSTTSADLRSASNVVFAGVVATFTDPNPTTPVASYSAAIDWGDGTTGAGAILPDPSIPGRFSVMSSQVYLAAGSFPTTVTITETGNTPAVVHGHATATALIENAAFSGTIASFGSMSTYGATASIAWGDGSTSNGTINSPYGQSGMTTTVSGSHTYTLAGCYPVVVTFHAQGGSTSTANTTLTVASAALTPAPQNIQVVEGAAFAGSVITFTGARSGAVGSNFTSLVSWGDGTTSAGTIADDTTSPGRFVASGSHVYAMAGIYSALATVFGAGGGTLGAFTATVTQAALTATGSAILAPAGAVFQGVASSFTDANPLATAADYVATITWGDGHVSDGLVAADPATLGRFLVSGSNTYVTRGHFATSVVVADAGGSATASGTADAVLTISAAEGATFSGVVAALTPSGTGPFSATIAWGDGTTSAGTVAADPNVSGGVLVSGSHLYSTFGTRVLAVRVTPASGPFTDVTSLALVAPAGLNLVMIPDLVATKGVSFSGPIANLAVANASAAASGYSATIAWGDGTSSAGSIAPVAGSPGAFQVVGTHTYQTSAILPMAVRVVQNGTGGGATTAYGAARSEGLADPTGTPTDVNSIIDAAWAAPRAESASTHPNGPSRRRPGATPRPTPPSPPRRRSRWRRGRRTACDPRSGASWRNRPRRAVPVVGG